MIKKENKLIQITLDPDTLCLLNSLADRFHITKTDIIKQALRTFAGSKKHHYSVALNIPKNNKKEEPNEPEQNWDSMLDELEKTK